MPADAGSDAGLDTGGPLRVRALGDVALLEPAEGGCLEESALLRLADGEELPVVARDERFVIVDEEGRAVRAGDVELLGDLGAVTPRAAVVQIDTRVSRYDEAGCPTEHEELAAGTTVVALARSHDVNYRGYVVIGADLALAPVRHVDADGWAYPWHAAVQLVKQVPEGFVVGGGVLIGERTILTVAHLGVDAEYCYSREPRAGEAWAAGLFVCGNIASVRPHPVVDAAIVELAAPEPPPYAMLRAEPVVDGEMLYANRFGMLNARAFGDAVVDSVGSVNAACAAWPDASSITTRDLVVGPGDSGGPAWIGHELVGLVHGEACRTPIEPARHVFVHVPGILDFVAP